MIQKRDAQEFPTKNSLSHTLKRASWGKTRSESQSVCREESLMLAEERLLGGGYDPGGVAVRLDSLSTSGRRASAPNLI